MATCEEAHYFNRDDYYGDENWYKQWFVGADQYHAVGEVTPDYDYNPHALKRIKAYNPRMKILFAMRDPVRRAISAYWMIRNVHRVKLPDIDIALSPVTGKAHPDILGRGHYSDTLDRIYQHFPRHQVLTYRLEDLRRDPLLTLAKITDFLEVDRFRSVNLTKQRVSQYESPANIEASLAQYYKPWNSMLWDKYSIYTGDWL